MRMPPSMRLFAIRPESAGGLAVTLEQRGDTDEAIAVYCNMLAVRPNYGHLFRLGGEMQGHDPSPEVAVALEPLVQPDGRYAQHAPPHPPHTLRIDTAHPNRGHERNRRTALHPRASDDVAVKTAGHQRMAAPAA